jgi:Uncharacterized protein conserved in bacteria (DUF2059)
MMSRILTVLLLTLATITSASEPDTQATRLAAAERYFATIDLKSLLDKVTSNDPEGAAIVKKHFRFEDYKQVALSALVKTFSTKELDAMTNFYGSPEGRSVIAKYPRYLAEVMPALMAQIQRVEAEAKRQTVPMPRNP